VSITFFTYSVPEKSPRGEIFPHFPNILPGKIQKNSWRRKAKKFVIKSDVLFRKTKKGLRLVPLLPELLDIMEHIHLGKGGETYHFWWFVILVSQELDIEEEQPVKQCGVNITTVKVYARCGNLLWLIVSPAYTTHLAIYLLLFNH
jgi:hypothetical protein